MVGDLIHSLGELERIADILLDEIKGKGLVVSRYMRRVGDGRTFKRGKVMYGTGCSSMTNKEDITRRIFTCGHVDDINENDFPEITVARDLQEMDFTFQHKGFPLPAKRIVHFEPVPTGAGLYDNEFAAFTRDHDKTRVSRELSVVQTVVVNSHGGVAIQSIPFFEINMGYGYPPIQTSRTVNAVCTTQKDIEYITDLIDFISDPTLDRRVRKAESFSEAFHHLHALSRLRFKSLEHAGFDDELLYDVVMLNGTPVHEIFGHHFEEPLRRLHSGESGNFKYGQKIPDKNLVMRDDPQQRVAGYRPRGFTFFDAYGRERVAVDHIKDGKVVGFLGSEYADSANLGSYIKVDKSEFIGNAVQDMDMSFPQPRMTCTVLDGKPEDYDFEGKIVVVPSGGETNQSYKSYKVRGSEAYIIKDGEPHRVVPLVVSGDINHALGRLLVLNDRSYDVGTCGKPDPLNRFQADAPVSMYTRNQIWRDQHVETLPFSEPHLKILKD